MERGLEPRTHPAFHLLGFMVWIGKTGVSGVLGFSFACGRRPHAKLNRRTERGHRTVAANMSPWMVDSDIGGPPDRSLGPGPAHEEILPWALAV